MRLKSGVVAPSFNSSTGEAGCEFKVNLVHSASSRTARTFTEKPCLELPVPKKEEKEMRIKSIFRLYCCRILF